jgi:hypothetical protein
MQAHMSQVTWRVLLPQQEVLTVMEGQVHHWTSRWTACLWCFALLLEVFFYCLQGVRSRGTSVWQRAKRFPRSEPPCHWRKCAAWWWSLHTFCCNSVSPPCYSILLLWSIPLRYLQAQKGAHGCISVVLFSLCMNENLRSVLKVPFWWWIHPWFQKRSQVIRSPPNPNGSGSCIGRVYELWWCP